MDICGGYCFCCWCYRRYCHLPRARCKIRIEHNFFCHIPFDLADFFLSLSHGYLFNSHRKSSFRIVLAFRVRLLDSRFRSFGPEWIIHWIDNKVGQIIFSYSASIMSKCMIDPSQFWRRTRPDEATPKNTLYDFFRSLQIDPTLLGKSLVKNVKSIDR